MQIVLAFEKELTTSQTTSSYSFSMSLSTRSTSHGSFDTAAAVHFWRGSCLLGLIPSNKPLLPVLPRFLWTIALYGLSTSSLRVLLFKSLTSLIPLVGSVSTKRNLPSSSKVLSVSSRILLLDLLGTIMKASKSWLICKHFKLLGVHTTILLQPVGLLLMLMWNAKWKLGFGG